ncbi:WD repeat-containing protein 55 [Ditylenchus destructor]|nr:WD repeat-containing protein 55 [Ditylenchus destructor]
MQQIRNELFALVDSQLGTSPDGDDICNSKDNLTSILELLSSAIHNLDYNIFDCQRPSIPFEFAANVTNAARIVHFKDNKLSNTHFNAGFLQTMAISRIYQLDSMEKTFSIPIAAVAVHPTQNDAIAIGFLDGLIRYCTFDVEKKKLQLVWSSRLKRAIRGLEFSEDGQFLYVISANRALCVYEMETGKRLRCIRKSHDNKPNKVCLLTTSEVVTGSEDGEVRFWDFRQQNALVGACKEQDDIVNAFGIYKNSLLVANGDCTLAAYDFRQKKLKVKSELMHSELLSLALTERHTYVGTSDGHIEIFNNGEYGNILERMATPFAMGVDSLIVLRPQLLLAGSAMDDETKFFHLTPNKQLHSLEQFGGADMLTKTKDSKYLVTASCDSASIRIRNLPDLLKKIPVLKAQDVHELKKKKQKATNGKNETAYEDFYKDLLGKDTDDEELSEGESSESENEEDEEEADDDIQSDNLDLDEEENSEDEKP